MDTKAVLASRVFSGEERTYEDSINISHLSCSHVHNGREVEWDGNDVEVIDGHEGCVGI